jgi:FixJ family two-component response regulator
MADVQKVVVVEDDPAMRTALGRLLTAGGYAPVSFGSAEEFLAASPRDRPVCFVLDIHLGAMSGLDLQRLLKVGGSDVPVILMTAFDEPRLRDEAARNGCLAYLLKGGDADELLGLLRSLSS